MADFSVLRIFSFVVFTMVSGRNIEPMVDLAIIIPVSDRQNMNAFKEAFRSLPDSIPVGENNRLAIVQPGTDFSARGARILFQLSGDLGAYTRWIDGWSPAVTNQENASHAGAFKLIHENVFNNSDRLKFVIQLLNVWSFYEERDEAMERAKTLRQAVAEFHVMYPTNLPSNSSLKEEAQAYAGAPSRTVGWNGPYKEFFEQAAAEIGKLAVKIDSDWESAGGAKAPNENGASENTGGMAAWEIALLVVGIVALLAITIIVVLVVLKKRKKYTVEEEKMADKILARQAALGRKKLKEKQKAKSASNKKP